MHKGQKVFLDVSMDWLIEMLDQWIRHKQRDSLFMRQVAQCWIKKLRDNRTFNVTLTTKYVRVRLVDEEDNTTKEISFRR